MATATLSHTHLAPAEGEAFWIVGDHLTFKVAGDKTGGRFAIAETVVQPGGGPPPHIHGKEDELFYIIEGQFLFILDKQVLTGGPGFAISLPKGVVHTFKNVGQTPGRFLVTTSPSGFESFIKAVGTPATAATTPVPPVTKADIDRILSQGPNFGMTLRPDWQPGAPGSFTPDARSLWVLGQRVDIRLTSRDTAGAFCVAEITTAPGTAVPPHKHRAMDEVFYVLSGTYRFQLGEEAVTAPCGTFIHVPPGVLHGFQNIGSTDGKLLDYHTPGGFERFFDAAGTPFTPGSVAPPMPERERLHALFEEHGMDIV
jgi:quercetin dioxygenase-like cupin family protein